MIHKVKNKKNFFIFDTLKVEKGMLMRILFQNRSKKRTTRTQYHFMALNLIIPTSNSDIEEVFIFIKFSKGRAYVFLKIIPSQTELFSLCSCHVVSVSKDNSASSCRSESSNI